MSVGPLQAAGKKQSLEEKGVDVKAWPRWLCTGRRTAITDPQARAHCPATGVRFSLQPAQPHPEALLRPALFQTQR